jgi:hypothetical protein
MIGLNAEFEYPSHDKILKVWPPMQVLQNAATILTQKNGTQHTRDGMKSGRKRSGNINLKLKYFQ